MAFRRDKQASLLWKTWLQKHHDTLLACGIPHVVLEEERNWTYFLEHGYLKPFGNAEPGINVERMTNDHMVSLCDFLEQQHLSPGCSALRRLQYLLKRGPDAEP